MAHPFEDRNFIDNVRRHFVCLTGRYLILDDKGNETGKFDDFAFSGFVIDILGRWCLITAGHVIDKINGIAKHPRAKLIRTGYADYFNNEAIVKETTYFDWDSTHKIHVDIDNVMDLGVIPLSDFYMASLKANGILPMAVSKWEGHSPPVTDYYALLGIPEETTQPLTGPREGKSVLLSMVPLLPLSRPPEEHVVSNIPRFAAKLHHGGDLKSPVGMSGGPMIGIQITPDGFNYACIAIQGSCDKTKTIVFGTPMHIVAKNLKELIIEQIKKQGIIDPSEVNFD